jgi:hypothetical protein
MGSFLDARSGCGAVQLSELLVDGATLAAGDNLIFDQFTFSSTNDMPSSAGLMVEPFQDAFGNFGIRLVGGMSDSAGGDPSMLSLGYRVSTVDGGGILTAISSATLAGNPAAVGEGSFLITESFEGIPTTLTIFDQVPDGSTLLLDSMNLPTTFSSLNVLLSVQAESVRGGVTASFIDQTFGTDNVIPEPASVVVWLGTLTLFGVVTLTYRRRSTGAAA